MEKKYFINLRGEQVGPLTRDQLRQQHLREGTLVWNEERWAWMPARSIQGLADLFSGPKDRIGGGLSEWFGAAHLKLERTLREFRRPRAL